VAERWATFDCYGTIVDWNAGIKAELEKLFGVGLEDKLLAQFHELEPEIQAANPGHTYREVLSIALERLAEETHTTRSRRRGTAAGASRSSPTPIAT
jgi:2-haloacid dehalogenase